MGFHRNLETPLDLPLGVELLQSVMEPPGVIIISHSRYTTNLCESYRLLQAKYVTVVKSIVLAFELFKTQGVYPTELVC